MSRKTKEGHLQQGDEYKGFIINRVLTDSCRKVEMTCTCGEKFTRILSNVRNRGSAGCDECCKTLSILSKRTHGLSKHKLYKTYRGMISRCTNPSHPCYQRYGGRGIKVCDRWLESFENFLEDVGEKTSERYTLDRIDNDGNYEPSNCRWATQKQQCNNFSANHIISYGDKEYTLTMLAEKLGIKQNTLTYRLKRGWSIEEAVAGKRKEKFKQPYKDFLSEDEFIKMLECIYVNKYQIRDTANTFGVSESNLSRIVRRDDVLNYWKNVNELTEKN